MVLDYKYKFLSFKDFDLYFNLYDKIGTYHSWHEGVAEGYNFWDKPFLQNKIDGTFNQVGVGIGIKKYLNDDERFYIDISANGGKLFTKNNTYSHNDSLKITDTNYNVKQNSNIFYIRINLGFKLFIK